jgi:hypothetical protein
MPPFDGILVRTEKGLSCCSHIKPHACRTTRIFQDNFTGLFLFNPQETQSKKHCNDLMNVKGVLNYESGKVYRLFCSTVLPLKHLQPIAYFSHIIAIVYVFCTSFHSNSTCCLPFIGTFLDIRDARMSST